MKNDKKQSNDEVIKIISQDRERTNILKREEQKAIAFLVQRVPACISSDILTAIGCGGNVIVFLSFVLANYWGDVYLLLGILGFIINWFGDSLDGRIAYYRNKQRKWYGFSLDLTVDWVGIALMGLGFIIYIDAELEIFGYCFVVLYGWEMVTALLRYKITGKYSIDSGLLGPTEARIIISLILILEVFLENTILYSVVASCVILLITNLMDSIKLLKLADARDREERREK